MILIIIWFIFLIIITYREQYLFSPWIITLFIWTIELISYLLTDHGLYHTSGNIEIGLFLYVTLFCLSSFITNYIFKKHNQRNIISHDYTNTKLYNILYYLCWIFVPLSFILSYRYAVSHAVTDNIFFNLRYTNNYSDFSLGPLKYINSIALVLLIATCNERKLNKIKITILYILNLILAITSMAKISLFATLISSLFILIYNKRIKKRMMIYSSIGFIFIVVLFAGLKSSTGNINDINVTEVISIYSLSPMVAYDYEFSNIEPNYKGEYTLKFYHALAQFIGIEEKKQSNYPQTATFSYVPYPTNVYTMLYRYYVDFGTWGIIMFSIINGFLYGYCFSKIRAIPWMKIWYAYLVTTLALQFFDEMLWLRLSLIIQIALISYLLYKNNDRNCDHCNPLQSSGFNFKILE